MANLGNLLDTAKEPPFVDLETCCRGRVARLALALALISID